MCTQSLCTLKYQCYYNFFLAQQPQVGQDLLIHEVSRTHNDAPQSVGLHWTSDQLVAKTSTLQHKHSQKTDIHVPGGIFFYIYFIYCSDVYIDATWAQVLHLLCLVNPFNPFGTFELLLIFRFTSVLFVSLRVVQFQHFKVFSCIGPACLLNLFPSSPFHEVYIVSEGEAPVVRTHNSNKRGVADLCLRPRGHWDRLY